MKNNEVKKIRITLEYTNPNTHTLVSVFTAIFGVVFMIGLVLLCILWL